MTTPADAFAHARFYGMRIVESIYLTEDGEPIEVKRGWRERLFTRPWRPLRATKTVIPKMPYRGALFLNNRTIAMHPETYRLFKDTGSP